MHSDQPVHARFLRVLQLAVGLVALGWGLPSRSEDPGALNVSWGVDGALTVGAFAAWEAADLARGTLAPLRCRWCGTDGLDARARDALLWSDPKAAAAASDVLAFGVPAGVAAYELVAARDLGSGARDVLLVAEATAVAGLVTQVPRFAFSRIRPNAYHSGRDVTRNDHLSFWSGHAVTVFSAAAAGGTVARLRGYQGWQWVYAAGFTGAALTGYLRVAGDKHWLTDVLASAAVGTTVGVLVPWLHRAGPGGTSLRVLPSPGGLLLAAEF